MTTDSPSVGLFVTCLVDLFRPTVGFAAVRLLEAAGCRVSVPTGQTCCGQPAYNSGARREAAAIARRVIAAFEPFDHVVAPSGSCAAMIRHHFPGLFDDDAAMRQRALALAARTWELASFLADVRGIEGTDVAAAGTAAYHDSCSGLRELGVRDQPRRLLDAVAGLELRELDNREACCGFGGAFCVKYPAISEAMVDAKVDAMRATGADMLLGGDLGCLLHLAGRLSRRGEAVAVRHVAEVLAGMSACPPIGGPGEP